MSPVLAWLKSTWTPACSKWEINVFMVFDFSNAVLTFSCRTIFRDALPVRCTISNSSLSGARRVDLILASACRRPYFLSSCLTIFSLLLYVAVGDGAAVKLGPQRQDMAVGMIAQ